MPSSCRPRERIAVGEPAQVGLRGQQVLVRLPQLALQLLGDGDHAPEREQPLDAAVERGMRR
jgi:hypothetical protein